MAGATQKRLMKELGITMESGPKPQVVSSKKVPPAVLPKPSYAVTRDITSNYHQAAPSYHQMAPPPPRTDYSSATYQNVADFPPPPSHLLNSPEDHSYTNYNQRSTPTYNPPPQRASPQPVTMTYQTTSNHPAYTFGTHQSSSRPANVSNQTQSSTGNQYSYSAQPKTNQNMPSALPTKTYTPSHGPTPPAGHQKSVSEAEVDALTNLLLQNMESSGEPDFYATCSKCNSSVIGEKNGCTAMDSVYHVDCFVCKVCNRKLKGLPFFDVESEPHCEPCYMNTLEKCSVCFQAITDRILRATGKPYHPECFTCVVCRVSLDGIPFTVDASNKVHCIDDFHKKFAPRCCVCHLPIMPENGQEETVRVVAMDRSFHVRCYKCEDCSLVLSSEAEGRGCYPMDDHILCKNCNSKRIQAMTHQLTTEL